MSLAKVIKLAKKFQEKFGQSGWKGDPLDFDAAKRDLGAFTEPKEYEDAQRAARLKSQQAKSNPQSSQQPSPSVPKASGLSPDIKAKLDVGSPGLKGMLLVTQNPDNPKNVRIDYNADRWKGGADKIKTILTNALPGYHITELYGHMNPSWTTNYF